MIYVWRPGKQIHETVFKVYTGTLFFSKAWNRRNQKKKGS